MNYLSSDQVKKYIQLNFSLIDLFCLFDLLNFPKTQLSDFTKTYRSNRLSNIFCAYHTMLLGDNGALIYESTLC